MRVVSGKYKGMRFRPPSKFPSRPTTDMAKEALFSILNARMYFDNLDVLDLFSGTGNISLEFLSRGVGSVVSVDKHPVSYRFQEKVAAELNETNWHILRQNAMEYLKNCNRQFDVIFADPPYNFERHLEIHQLVFENNLLVDDGLLIIEHSDRIELNGVEHYKETRSYGGVCFSFYEPK